MLKDDAGLATVLIIINAKVLCKLIHILLVKTKPYTYTLDYSS